MPGGALTSARGAISHLWSSFTTTNNSTNTAESPLADSAMEATETQCIDAQEHSYAMPAAGMIQPWISSFVWLVGWYLEDTKLRDTYISSAVLCHLIGERTATEQGSY